MDSRESYFNKLRKNNLRITNSRRAMIDVLENNHLTFKEIQNALAKKGFTNISTIYNNLDFLIEQKIVVELYINDTKYYDLAIDNPMHNADSHVHVVVKDTNKITEINNTDIFDYIKQIPELKDLHLDYIRITIGARKKKTY
ncbi:Fur family ferric uptake transcriptional regulator/Fur family peroxide stress response transcriptional regulator [Acholeplasma morum]|jgi:Fur family ferric uptake transcriptional regulator/Fur family peroxide stress response transcriptional regulator|uniref:Fur family transcriptional regulator n=1 Tax=Paracholeplasma morum TaxID=264637 RepID=UPI00195C4EAF|nr:transcriptional repressor [Paracholeplasma morum]MBM7452756.1 Fur family ferric uptake transcriptional regulator/Fur family peroxide stress response transcriptional regulator [Paracholeplasma morum]